MFKKYFAGGLAASAALAPLAATAPVHAAPAESPQQSPALPGELDPSTLESCSANFDLTKGFISFDETITGSATPVPHVSNGIIPVITFIDGGDEVSCILEPAWTDEASFLTALEGPPPGFFPYPGGGYYFAPDNTDLLPGGASYHVDLFLQAPYTGVWTVTWSGDITPNLLSIDSLLAALIVDIHDGLPENMQAAWDEYAADIEFTLGSSACPPMDDPDLAAALLALAGGQAAIDEYLQFADTSTETDCLVLEVLMIQSIWNIVLNMSVVPVTISSGDGGSSPAVPVVGSSPTPLVLTASTLAALGTGMVFASRRRRRQPA